MSLRSIFAAFRRRAVDRRASFKQRWQAFCQETFESPDELAAAFAVSPRTASYWLEGTVGGSGFAVDIAYQDYPEQAARHLRASQ